MQSVHIAHCAPRLAFKVILFWDTPKKVENDVNVKQAFFLVQTGKRCQDVVLNQY